MWSRRAAWESITTRRRRLVPPLAPSPELGTAALAAGFASPLGLASAFAWGAGFAAAFGAAFLGAASFLAFGFVLVAVADPPPSPDDFSAARASDSSTLD